MTDLFTDELFLYEKIPPENRFVFPCSCLLCDVERFRDDAEEIMAARGNTRTSDGEPLREILRRTHDGGWRLFLPVDSWPKCLGFVVNPWDKNLTLHRDRVEKMTEVVRGVKEKRKADGK